MFVKMIVCLVVLIVDEGCCNVQGLVIVCFFEGYFEFFLFCSVCFVLVQDLVVQEMSVGIGFEMGCFFGVGECFWGIMNVLCEYISYFIMCLCL